ncbi:MAG: protoporphyrinogen oxidase [Acidobacteria bacterium]|nr:protoporphyrinogen oxidase [Acidobacteriota bacterium]
MSSPRRIAIVGAGISGLATAFFLHKESPRYNLEVDLTVLESSNHLGGVIRTEKVGGFLLEAGPEAFVTSKPAILEFVDELGLSRELVGSNDHIRQTFVVNNLRLYPLPEGMAFLAPIGLQALWSTSLVSNWGKIRALLEPLVRRGNGDPSVHAFLERRLGRELTHKIAEPLVSAIYGGDVRQLSAPSALPETYQLEQKFGSLWRGLRAAAKVHPSAVKGPRFLTPHEGMSRLVDCIVSQLGRVAIHRGVTGLHIYPTSGAYRLRSADFEDAFDLLVLCTPAGAGAEIIKTASVEACQDLNQIPYTSTILVFLAYKRSEFSHPLKGFGFVVPESESTFLDACTWVSSKFPDRCPPDAVLLRCAIHDGRRPRPAASDEEMVDRVHHQIKQILGISCAPTFFRVFRVPKAMPQFNVGHSRRLEGIKSALAQHPGVFISGAFSGGVGIPDCVRMARETAAAAAQFLLRHSR